MRRNRRTAAALGRDVLKRSEFWPAFWRGLLVVGITALVFGWMLLDR